MENKEQIEKAKKKVKEIIAQLGRTKGFRDYESFKKWAGETHCFYFTEVEELLLNTILEIIK